MNIIPFRTKAERRVDQLVRAMTHDGPRKLVTARHFDGSIVVRVGEIETWHSVNDADELRAELDAAIREAERQIESTT